MSRISSWMALQLSRSLEPHERDALRGDHAELGVSGGQALYDVLGLVMRRQLQAWKAWPPWLALFAIVLPLGFTFSQASFEIGSAIGAEPQADWFAWALYSALLLLFGIWSWTAGYVMATLSRRAVFVNSGLVALVWIAVLAMYLFDPAFYSRLAAGRAGLPLAFVIALLYNLAAFAGPWSLGLIAGQRRCLPRRLASSMLFAVPALAAAAFVWFVSGRMGLYKALQASADGGVLCWPAAWILVKSFRAGSWRPQA